MKFRQIAMAVGVFLGGMTCGMLFFGSGWRAGPALSTVRAAERARQDEVDATALQALAMTDVDYHARNLWFAGSVQNWPLADYYWKQTQANLRRAIDFSPTRTDANGHEVDLVGILRALEKAPHMNVGEAIEKQDSVKFAATYRNLLEGCFHCHKQADRASLRPKVPQPPAASIINFGPKADWPK
jgi:hypothetical protein